MMQHRENHENLIAKKKEDGDDQNYLLSISNDTFWVLAWALVPMLFDRGKLKFKTSNALQ